MGNILIDMMGLLTRKKVVKTYEDTDFLVLGRRPNPDDSMFNTPKMHNELISLKDLRAQFDMGEVTGSGTTDFYPIYKDGANSVIGDGQLQQLASGGIKYTGTQITDGLIIRDAGLYAGLSLDSAHVSSQGSFGTVRQQPSHEMHIGIGSSEFETSGFNGTTLSAIVINPNNRIEIPQTYRSVPPNPVKKNLILDIGGQIDVEDHVENPVNGTGTTDKVLKWKDGALNKVGDSSINDDGSEVIVEVDFRVDGNNTDIESAKLNMTSGGIDLLNATDTSKGITFTHPGGGTSADVYMYYNGTVQGSRFVISRQATGGAEIELESDGDINLNRVGNGKVLVGSQIDMDSNKIINLADPTAAQDAATKAYVDANSGGGTLNTEGFMATTGSVDLATQALKFIGKDGIDVYVGQNNANEVEIEAAALVPLDGSRSMNGGYTPSNAQDVATKAYVDSQSGGGGITETKGNWTPQVIAMANTTTPETGWNISSYAINQGRWMRHGTLVQCEFNILIQVANITKSSGQTGFITIQGWPYDAGNSGLFQDARTVQCTGFDVAATNFTYTYNTSLVGDASINLNAPSVASNGVHGIINIKESNIPSTGSLTLKGVLAYETTSTTLNPGATIQT